MTGCVFELRISLEDAALHDAPRPELARMLRDVADRIARGESGKLTVLDINGNTVGRAVVRTI